VIDKIAPRFMRTIQGTTPYPEIASRLHKSRHDFAFSRNHTFCQQNRGTLPKIPARFWVSKHHKFEGNFNKEELGRRY